MSVSLSFVGNASQFLSNSGLPLGGGLLYTYGAGSTTPQTTYTTSLGNVANANPIVLDAGGRTPSEVWLTDGLGYKFVLVDIFGNTIGTWDNLYGGISTSNPLIAGNIQYVGTVGGSANAITLTPTIAATAYTAGLAYSFTAGSTNTGATTVNVSGVGITNIYQMGGAALTGGEITANGMYILEYSSVLGGFSLINPSVPVMNTFTPTILFGGGNTGMVYGSQLGYYTTIGRLCFFLADVSYTTKGSSTGAAVVGGLPFTISNSMASNFLPCIGNATKGVDITSGANALQLTPLFLPNTKTIQLNTIPKTAFFGSNLQLADTDFAAAAAVRVSGFYFF